jgi:DNA repair protein RadC
MDNRLYLGHRKRLKERFNAAPALTADSELLELLLGYVIKRRDVKPQAKELIALAHNICGVFFNTDVTTVKGLGEETTTFLNLVKELTTRINYQLLEGKVLDNTEAVYQFLRTKIAFSDKETFLLIFVDSGNRLKGYNQMNIGTADNIPIDIRAVMESVLSSGARGVILAHNHPSGFATPSKTDKRLTRQIAQALTYAGVKLLDHVIVTVNGYYSMKGNGDIL